MHRALVRIGQLRIAAGQHRIDDVLGEPDLPPHLDVRLADIVGVPVLRDDEDADLDLALRQRALFVEISADVLHAARDGRRMNPYLVRAEDAAAPGDELFEHLFCSGSVVPAEVRQGGSW
jgi:hypothetical protein